ncbi:hypothetical protein TruAng_003932 [Truncatella angustata]|nr:hypothetical protein TruAng_003932 [Truncatella angustata]
MSEKITYRGNCHCGKFKFEADLTELKTATSCDCVACHKNGILWAFPANGDYRIIRDDGSLTSTRHGDTLDHKVRTLLDVNPFALEIEQSSHPEAKVETIDSTVDAEGLKTYKGSCICGAATFDFKTRPLPELSEGDIKEDNCSICVRNAYIGVYPTPAQVTIPPTSDAEAATYAWGSKFSGLRFCRHCGVQLWSDLWGPPAEVVATWPEARQQMVKRKLNIKPLNVRVLEGVEWDQIEIQRSDEGTEGYVVD